MSGDEHKAGLSFTHQMMMQTAIESGRTRVEVLALTEELLNTGVFKSSALVARLQRLQDQLDTEIDPATRVMLSPVDDKYALTDLPEIDCSSLVPLCKASCCMFTYVLSRQDVLEGVVDWELAAPYETRRREDGYCTHNCSEAHVCQVYEKRPATCRVYDCRADARIWVDFDRRIPAHKDPLGISRDGSYRTDHDHEEVP